MQIRRHADRVIERTLASDDLTPLTASWRRSAMRHGLDPAVALRAPRLTGVELAQRREALERLLHIAAAPIDELFRLVGSSGCAVVLTDAQGIVLDRRAAPGDVRDFDGWALAPGADWSEAAQGTNGIGTCLVEGRGVVIHRDEHFLSSNIALSCIDAPIHGPDGQLLAALDVSSARDDASREVTALIAATVGQYARRIEAAWFRAAFPGTRTVVAGEGIEALVAVDRDDLAVGATRAARRVLGLPRAGALHPQPLSDLLARAQGRDAEPGGLVRAERAAVVRALARSGGNVTAAARALGVGRATLYRRMRRLGISAQSRD